MKPYQSPEVEIVLFQTEDVIFESDNYVPWNQPGQTI